VLPHQFGKGGGGGVEISKTNLLKEGKKKEGRSLKLARENREVNRKKTAAAIEEERSWEKSGLL